MSKNLLRANNILCGYLNTSQLELENKSTTALVVGSSSTDTFIVDTSTNTITMNGDLNVVGNATFTSTQSFSVSDSLVEFANSNPADVLDIGFFGKYVSSGTKYAGMFRSAGTNEFILFRDATVLPNNTVTYSSLADLKVGNLTGTLSTATQTAITSVGTLSALTLGGTLNLATNNITNGGTITATTLAGTLSTATQTNITSVGTLTGLSTDTTAEVEFTSTYASGQGLGGNIKATQYGGTGAYGAGISMTHARGTSGSPTPLQASDVLGGIWGRGCHQNGSLTGNTFAIRANAVSTWTASNAETSIDFATTTLNATSRAVRMILNGYGGLTVGNTTDLASSTYKLYSNGASFINGTLTATTLAGTLSTASQTNITSVGTLTGLTCSGTVSLTNSTNATKTLTVQNPSNGYGIIVKSVAPASNERAFFTLGADASANNGFQLGQSINADTTKDFFIYDAWNSSCRVLLGANGGFNIGTSTSDSAGSTYKLYVNGATNITGQTRIQDGTNTDPAITFTSDTDTGIYRYGSNALGISLGGTGYQLNATTMTNVVGLYQSTAGFTTQNLTGLTSITGGNASIMGISSAYQWTGSCTCTTNGTGSTASFEMKLPVSASGGQVNYTGGTINGTISTYLVVGRITSSTQTYVSISLLCNNIWADAGTIYLNFSLQYRNE